MKARPYIKRRDGFPAGPKISDETSPPTCKPQPVDEASRLSHVSEGPPGLGVAASPLNSVKLDIGVILVLGALLLLIHSFLLSGIWLQLALLLSYGIGATLWVMFRVGRIMRASQSQRYAHGHDAQAHNA